MGNPSGKGEIVNWDRYYCYKCKKQFKSRMSLWMHLTNAKVHKKKEESKKSKKIVNLDSFLNGGEIR